MADTIITNTPGTNDDSSGAGLIVAFVLVVALVIGGIMLYQRGYIGSIAAPKTSDTNINVTIPNPVTPAPAAQ